LLGMLWTVSQLNHVVISSTKATIDNNQQSPNANKSLRLQQQQQQQDTQLTPERMMEQFIHRYGKASHHMLQNGYQSFGTSSIDATARRLLQASHEQRPFVMAFAGYSVTVGRGNYYHQSFPFVLGRLLEPLLRDSLHIPSVIVRNSAIGGIPSFPYGFCFTHFLGSDADVVSWDYSMNEGSGAAVLEAYLRQSQAQLVQTQPMMIVLDTNRQRCQLLEHYVQQGLLHDAACVGTAKDVVPAEFLELPEHQRPAGLQKWNEFGAPDSCPGRGPWHPKKMEHEMIAWLMAVHFIKATERALEMRRDGYPADANVDKKNLPMTFPEPLVSGLPPNEAAVNDLLYGHRLEGSDQRVMKHVSCRTNFLPATDQERVLSSIVVSGLAHDVTAETIMTERSDTAYNWGWVYDVSSLERDTKVKVEKCGGLGYVDMKIALYGIPESGTLRLWLPSSRQTPDSEPLDDNAKSWFDTIIVCEANEKRPNEACHLDADIEYTVGGVSVTSVAMVSGAGEYLKRKTCVHVGVPHDARITRLKDVTSADGKELTSDDRARLAKGLSDQHVGILFDLKAKAPVTRKNGACCVSHVVWEHH
jgi:hypothetical protein